MEEVEAQQATAIDIRCNEPSSETDHREQLAR